MASLQKIEERATCAAEEALERQSYVSVIDVLMGMKLLHVSHVREWERGRIPYLEQMIQGNPDKIKHALSCFQRWTQQKGLKARKTMYWARTSGPKKKLRFTENEKSPIEQIYCTHYISHLMCLKKSKKDPRKTLTAT